MSAPDDHAVLDSHQFLDVVALHIKVRITPTTCPATPSTVKADKDRYKGHADISNTVQDRPSINANRESQRPLARVAITPEVRRERVPS